MLAWINQHRLASISIVVVALLLAWGFTPKPIAVPMAEVVKAPLAVTLEEEGQTRVIERYTVTAPTAGIISRLLLHIGDTVNTGDTLFHLTPLPAQPLTERQVAEVKANIAQAKAALEAAKNQLEEAQASAELAQLELVRSKKLLDQKLIAKADYDRADADAKRTHAAEHSAAFNIDVARYQLAAHEAQLTQAHSDANKDAPLSITAPVAGRLLKYWQKSEGAVHMGDPLLEIGNTRELEIEVELLSADAVKVKPGMAVNFHRWGGDQPLLGSVKRVEPVAFTKVSALGVEEQRTLVISSINSPYEQWESLGDGYRVEAEFILWQNEEVLQIPSSALFRQDTSWNVFKVVDQRAQLTAVELGKRNGLQAEVLSGLVLGDTVINRPPNELSDGSKVTPY